MEKKALKKQAEATIPTDWGRFIMKAYASSDENSMPHVVLESINLDKSKPIILRIHSECMTGDLFHSNKCDCGEQLNKSMHTIQKNGGMLIYLRQEGRGIGLINKLKAYQKQEEGFNTIEANVLLGFEADSRDFGLALEILREEGIQRVKLLTNNPEKLDIFKNSGIELVERLELEIPPEPDNHSYLKTKKEDLGHLLKSI